jgi:hypothetical protein
MAFPGTYNFNYYRGDTAEFVVRPKVGSTGAVFQLNDYNAEFTIATARGVQATQFNASAVVNETSDIVTCTITPTVGRLIPPGTYVYDVQVENGIQVYTLLTGTITVTDDITGAA